MEVEKAISEHCLNYFDFSNFTIIEKIDNDVFKACWKDCKQIVVLKRPKVDKSIDMNIVNKELQILQQVSKISFHTNIIEFYGKTKDNAVTLNVDNAISGQHVRNFEYNKFKEFDKIDGVSSSAFKAIWKYHGLVSFLK
ncbi:6654_t:CDS:2, partial [Scutellospora calospora]